MDVSSPDSSTKSTVRKDDARAVIVGAAGGVMTCLTNGMFKSLGVLLPELRDEFSTKTWVIGLIISLTQGFGAIICPMSGAITKRITARYTTMIFGFLSAMGLVFGSLTTDITMLAVCILVSGFTVGADAVMFAEYPVYLDKYYDTAAALSTAGVGVGVMIMPILTQFFIDVYGWRGTMLLIGGIILHVILCGALLKPVVKHNPKSTEHHEDNRQEQQHGVSNIGLNLFKSSHFLSLMCIGVGAGYIVTGWIIYLVPHALELGFEPYDAAALATVGGFGHIIGCVIFPFLPRIFSSKQLLYNTAIVNSLALLMDPISSAFVSYVGLMMSSATVGFGRALIYLIVFKLMTEEIDDDKKAIVMLWFYFFESCGSLVSGFLSGWLFDQTGSYTASFLVLGAVPLFTIFPRLIWDIRQYLNSRPKYISVSTIDLDNEIYRYTC